MRPLYGGLAVAAASLSAALVAATWAAARAVDRPFRFFSADVYDLYDAPLYTNALGNVTVLVWWTAATTGVLGGALALLHRHRAGSALLAAGVVSAWLGLDDFFSIHEQVLPDIVGIPEKAVYAGYLALALAFAWRWRSFFAGPRLLLALAAAGLLGLSVAADVLAEGHHVIEDGAKLTGAALWAALLAAAVLDELGPRRLGRP